MSMELFVLSDGELASVADWQRAIDQEGYPLRLNSDRSIASLSGFLPALLRETKTGFECDTWPADGFMSDMSHIDFGHKWKHVLAFRWGGNLSQVPAVWMAATAYAAATDGVVFDEEAGVLRSVNDARTMVTEIERELPEMEAMLRGIMSGD